MIRIKVLEDGSLQSGDVDISTAKKYRPRGVLLCMRMSDDLEVVMPDETVSLRAFPERTLVIWPHGEMSTYDDCDFDSMYEPVIRPGIDWAEQEEKPEWFVGPHEGKVHQGCASCAPVQRVASMGTLVAVGFGEAHVSRDGVVLFSEPSRAYDTNAGIAAQNVTLEIFERLAAAQPNADWRLVLHAPLRSREYQRHGPGKWVLIESGMGFA